MNEQNRQPPLDFTDRPAQQDAQELLSPGAWFTKPAPPIPGKTEWSLQPW